MTKATRKTDGEFSPSDLPHDRGFGWPLTEMGGREKLRGLVCGQGGEIGRRARLRIWCRKACRFESCPWQLFFREGSIPFVDTIDRAIVRNVEGLLPMAITEVADGFKGSSRHFGGRLFRKVSSSFDQASAICFIIDRQIQYLH